VPVYRKTPGYEQRNRTASLVPHGVPLSWLFEPLSGAVAALRPTLEPSVMRALWQALQVFLPMLF
jgi:hypothetical protein